MSDDNEKQDKSGALIAAIVADLSPDLRRKLAAELQKAEGQAELKTDYPGPVRWPAKRTTGGRKR